jgi:peptide subunit release factor 1 (eRF1)
VLGAITSAQQRLKLYNKARCCCAISLHEEVTRSHFQVPTNGLVLYTGTILTDDGKEKKVNIDFEPFKTINTSLYLCDNKFHTEALSELLESENKYGFIVMDGNGALFGTLSGNTREARSARSLFAAMKRQRMPPSDPAQVYCRPPQEARPWWSVRTSVCPPAHGEASQLRPQGETSVLQRVKPQLSGPYCTGG